MEFSTVGLLFVIAWILLNCRQELGRVNDNLCIIASKVDGIENKLMKLDEISLLVECIEAKQEKLKALEALKALKALDGIQVESRHTKDYLKAISGAINAKEIWGEWRIKLPWHYGE